jgi:hypothetical protein
MDTLLISNYADFKLLASQFTSGKIFFCTTPVFKIWAMASGFPLVEVVPGSQPGTFTTDFPSAVQLSAPMSTGAE